jgi:hypothetical protein
LAAVLRSAIICCAMAVCWSDWLLCAPMRVTNACCCACWVAAFCCASAFAALFCALLDCTAP